MGNTQPPHDERTWSLGFLVLALASVVPLWLYARPPIQDLPQHLAAIRLLHDFHDPSLAFARFFEVDLWRTQYLAYYLVADLLAYPFGVPTANRLLITAAMIGTPYGCAALIRQLGGDRRFAVLAFPLVYNAHLILGFLNFLAAIPLALYGISLCIKQRRSFSSARAVGIATLLLLCFYTHVVPFAFLGLGATLCLPFASWREPRSWRGHVAPLLPASIAALLWSMESPAGQATVTAASGARSGPKPRFQSYEQALADLPNWMTDVLHGELDRQLLMAFGALLLLCLLLGLVPALSERAPDALARSLTRRLRLLPLLAGLLYFVMPTGYDWIWPIAQRFPLLCALCLIPVLPRPRGTAATVVLWAAITLGATQFHLMGKAFADFSRDEVGNFDAALEVIPPGQKVAGLIFQRHSNVVRFSPFIHYVAYYQAEKGGAVMFTFADFPQSPFRFRQDNRPPTVPPRWEWLPRRVSPRRDLQWYDYVLVRGNPGSLARQAQRYKPLYRDAQWSVWRRRQGAH